MGALHLDQGLLLENLKQYVMSEPSAEEKYEIAYYEYFGRLFGFAVRGANEVGFLPSLDYSQLTFDDLNFLASQLCGVPNAEEGGWYPGDVVDDIDIRRDRVLRVVFGEGQINKQDIIRAKAVRRVEAYF